MENQTVRLQSDNLNLEFKRILAIIRQYIPYINSNAYLMQCRIWLEKLSSSNINKVYRNVYLSELCKQIQADKLLPPFNEAPPNGDLKELKRFLGGRMRKFQYSKIASSLFLNNNQEKRNSFLNNTENWEYVEPLKSDEELYEASVPKPNQKNQIFGSSQNHGTKSKIFPDTFDEIEDTKCSGEPAYNSSETEVPLNAIKLKEIVIDDSSWSDLTDASSSADFKSVLNKKGIEGIQNNRDTSGENQDPSFNINNIINKQTQNASTKHIQPNSYQSENPLTKLHEVQLGSSLKLLKDTNYISQDWKETIAALQLRLSEMIQQNTELKAVIQKLEMQSENDKIKNRVEKDHNLKMSENLYNQEIAKLKEIHTEKIFQAEKSFQANYDNLRRGYEEKIKFLSNSYEQQILEIKKQHEEVLNKRDSEIYRLSEIIQDQCLRIMNDISGLKNQVSNCTCEKKVHVLKKCVSKIDKLFQKSEKEYIKQIERLRQELELKESSLQVQLKMQKAELIAQTRTGQKEEFEEVLNSLEVKYIKMLEGHEHQIMNAKKLDDEKIRYLTELLDKNNISYNDTIEYRPE